MISGSAAWRLANASSIPKLYSYSVSLTLDWACPIDRMHWHHVSITTTPCWGVKTCCAARTCCAGRAQWRSASQSVHGPGPARRYGMQGLTLWLHAWRWRTWQCLNWPPTRGGALLWRHMHMVYGQVHNFKLWMIASDLPWTPSCIRLPVEPALFVFSKLAHGKKLRGVINEMLVSVPQTR